MTWCHDVTKLINFSYYIYSPIYQLVDVLKWWYTCISVDISVDGFQAIIVYVFALKCLHVITWRHDVTKITTWRQETNCLHLSLQMCSRANFIFVSVISLVAELNLIIVVVFAWWNNVTKWRHDVIKHAAISACRRTCSVAYLGFQKGGAKFSLATSAHTKGGAKPSFPIFLVCQKKFFLAKGGGAMAQWPPP